MDTTFEKHYTIAQLAELWGFSKESIRREVLKEINSVAKKCGPSGRIAYRIPESVARRIHTRLIAPTGKPALSLAR